MTYEPCPEALYGQHGEPNTMGRCPYCGRRLSARPRLGKTAEEKNRATLEQDPLNIEPDEGSYYEE